MRFAATAVLAFAASVLAQKAATDGFDPVTSPAKDQSLEAGKTFDITWQVADQYKDLKVDIELLGGADPEHLVPMNKIATGIDNAAGKFSWQVDSKLGKEAKYGLSISNAANADIFQYSFPFSIKAGAGGDGTVTMTSAQGVKTVRLSSMTTPTTTSTTSTSTSSVFNTTTSYNTTTSHNMTTSMHKPTSSPVVIITTTEQPAVTTSEPTPSSSPTDNAAANLGAGVMAAVGGVAVALLAL